MEIILENDMKKDFQTHFMKPVLLILKPDKYPTKTNEF